MKNTQIKFNSEKAINAKQNFPGFVAFYGPQPGNEVGLFYNAPKHRALSPADLWCLNSG